MKAINFVGEDTKTVENAIYVTPLASSIKNLALNKPTYASGFVTNEDPYKAVDGTTQNNSKWCAVGEPPHWIVIELQNEVLIHKFVVRHAETGGENPDWNTRAFRFEVSIDKENWVEVVKIVDNTKGISEHPIKPIRARYVRMIVDKPTQGGDKAARIYEIEVYGIEF